MWFFIFGVILLIAASMISLLLGNRTKHARTSALVITWIGCALALFDSISVLYDGRFSEVCFDWPIPLGKITLGLDPLSAIFVAIISIIAAVAALYGKDYLQHFHCSMSVGAIGFCFNVLTAMMLLVVTARNGLLFLMCWEGMSLASFFLVISEYDREQVRRAGWIYLVAMHLGTMCLFVMFLLLGKSSGTLDFAHFSVNPSFAGVFFILAVIGFGTKAGLVPLHVWLPEAHPAAPSHVSAVMSGVMIKTGIYGFLRTLTFFSDIPSWCAWTMLGIGILSAVLGVLFALAQNDLKRLLAYSSMENIGIIATGVGVGMLGISYNIPIMAALGFLGALLHVINHSLFKSLLFMGAGAVQHGCGTRDMNSLGGLLKRMPITGTAFLIGACAICGLPMFNGFLSEFLIYLGALGGIMSDSSEKEMIALLCVMVVGGLALTGGLAAICFTKAFGGVFLGEPRTDEARNVHEAGATMLVAQLIPAALCVLIAFTAPVWPIILKSAVTTICPAYFAGIFSENNIPGVYPLTILCCSSWGFLGIGCAFFILRKKLLANRNISKAPTWDCGYTAANSRMQYTPSSFSSPLVYLFRIALRPRITAYLPRGFFPAKAGFQSDVPDVFHEYVYHPIFMSVAWAASKLRWLQHGRIQLYVLYIALTILVLLLWKLG